MGYSGAWEKLIHEKTWSRKSRGNIPLTGTKQVLRVLLRCLFLYCLEFFLKQNRRTFQHIHKLYSFHKTISFIVAKPVEHCTNLVRNHVEELYLTKPSKIERKTFWQVLYQGFGSGSALIWAVGSGSAYKFRIRIRIQKGKNNPKK